MKKYKSSDLTHKRAEVLKEAKANSVIIQECNTNGEVRQEYLLVGIDHIDSLDSGDILFYNNSGSHVFKG